MCSDFFSSLLSSLASALTTHTISRASLSSAAMFFGSMACEDLGMAVFASLGRMRRGLTDFRCAHEDNFFLLASLSHPHDLTHIPPVGGNALR